MAEGDIDFILVGYVDDHGNHVILGSNHVGRVDIHSEILMSSYRFGMRNRVDPSWKHELKANLGTYHMASGMDYSHALHILFNLMAQDGREWYEPTPRGEIGSGRSGIGQGDPEEGTT